MGELPGRTDVSSIIKIYWRLLGARHWDREVNEKCKIQSSGANRQRNDFSTSVQYKLSKKDAEAANKGGYDYLWSWGRFHLENMRTGHEGWASPHRAEKEEESHSWQEKTRYKGMEARERSHALAGTRGSSRHSIDFKLTPLSNGEFELESAVIWSMV